MKSMKDDLSQMLAIIVERAYMLWDSKFGFGMFLQVAYSAEAEELISVASQKWPADYCHYKSGCYISMYCTRHRHYLMCLKMCTARNWKTCKKNSFKFNDSNVVHWSGV